jgi:hypothetical protein
MSDICRGALLWSRLVSARMARSAQQAMPDWPYYRRKVLAACS